MYQQLTVEQAMGLMMELSPPLPPEQADTAQAVGRPLCADGIARRDLPPFDSARVTGYALRAADLHRANHKRPALLQVVARVRAGQTASIPVRTGQAVWVEQGAPLPDGCDCVVPMGDTDGGEEQVSVLCQLWPFDNLWRQGALTAAGEVLCPAGEAPDTAKAALLRAAGVASVSLRPLARLGVLTVGEHLAPAEWSVLPPAKTADFNRLYLSECWRDQVEGVLCLSASRRLEDIMAACKEMLPTGLSLLLTAGGQAQVGDALTQLGAEGVFSGLKLRGQASTALYRYRQTLILVLPDDPFSAGVAARLLVPPVLGALGEHPALLPQRKSVRLLGGPLQARPERRFLPAKLTQQGLLLVDPEGESLLSLCGMELLVDIPGGTKPLPGETVGAFHLP